MTTSMFSHLFYIFSFAFLAFRVACVTLCNQLLPLQALKARDEFISSQCWMEEPSEEIPKPATGHDYW